MALARRNPATDLDFFRRQMDRVFNDLSSSHPLDFPTWSPAIELSDGDDHLILKAQLPGLNQDDIDVSVNRNSVTISGEYRQQNEGNTYGSEFQYGKFTRTISLPVGIKQDQVTAEYNNGILYLNLPKVDDAVNRSVKIELGSHSNKAIEGQASS